MEGVTTTIGAKQLRMRARHLALIWFGINSSSSVG